MQRGELLSNHGCSPHTPIVPVFYLRGVQYLHTNSVTGQEDGGGPASYTNKPQQSTRGNHHAPRPRLLLAAHSSGLLYDTITYDTTRATSNRQAQRIHDTFSTFTCAGPSRFPGGQSLISPSSFKIKLKGVRRPFLLRRQDDRQTFSGPRRGPPEPCACAALTVLTRREDDARRQCRNMWSSSRQATEWMSW